MNFPLLEKYMNQSSEESSKIRAQNQITLSGIKTIATDGQLITLMDRLFIRNRPAGSNMLDITELLHEAFAALWYNNNDKEYMHVFSPDYGHFIKFLFGGFNHPDPQIHEWRIEYTGKEFNHSNIVRMLDCLCENLGMYPDIELVVAKLPEGGWRYDAIELTHPKITPDFLKYILLKSIGISRLYALVKDKSETSSTPYFTEVALEL